MKPPRSLSLRSKFILIVLVGAVLPLALLGLWLTRTAERSGEELLRARLDTSMRQIVDEIGLRWLSRRSQLLRLAECPAVQGALRGGGEQVDDESVVQTELRAIYLGMEEDVASASVRDVSGAERWSVSTDEGPGARTALVSDPALSVELGIYDVATGARIGTLNAQVRMSSLLPSGAGWGGVSGSVLAVFDRSTGASLLPLSIDPVLFARDQFTWGEEPWLTVRHELHEPPMQLSLAAPVTPFAEPFQEAARRNLWILGIVAIGGFALAALLTRRTTGALVRLAAAAEDVSRGELDRRVEEASEDEVGRVARAFNSMTESLQDTLRELSQRKALAAVGEFAASLAHEVRNPLTSIRLDLQRVEEQLPEDGPARELLGRALGEIDRVDRSVTGALRVARSGSVTLGPVDVRQPLDAALHAASPELDAHKAKLEIGYPDDDPIWVEGDAPALEQLFLNLLINAAQSFDSGGRVEVTVARHHDVVSIAVRDSGRGIPLENIERVVDPFFSTRSQGTGLGLAIAQRIAAAHGGELELESAPGAGTTARVRLSRAATAA